MFYKDKGILNVRPFSHFTQPPPDQDDSGHAFCFCFLNASFGLYMNVTVRRLSLLRPSPSANVSGPDGKTPSFAEVHHGKSWTTVAPDSF